jgi:hypothetical protein
MKQISFALLILILSAIVSANGWHITTRSYSKNENTANARIEQVFLHNGYMKMVTGELTTIFDLKNGEIIYLNQGTQKYWKGSPAKFNAEVKAELEIIIDQQLYGMESEQQEVMRAMYQEMLKASFPDVSQAIQEPRNFSVRKDKDGEMISGFTSTLYRVTEDNMPFENIWISAELPIAKDFDFISLSQFLNQLASGAYAVSFESTREYFNLIEKGYPVKVEMYRSDGSTQISEVIEAKRVDLTHVDFSVPKGFMAGTLSDVGVWDGYR